jgi:hypothetical protein
LCDWKPPICQARETQPQSAAAQTNRNHANRKPNSQTTDTRFCELLYKTRPRAFLHATKIIDRAGRRQQSVKAKNGIWHFSTGCASFRSVCGLAVHPFYTFALAIFQVEETKLGSPRRSCSSRCLRCRRRSSLQAQESQRWGRARCGLMCGERRGTLFGSVARSAWSGCLAC